MSAQTRQPQHTTATDAATATDTLEPSDVWTIDQVRALGATTTLTTAASILGISRSQAYRLAATGTFPTPIIRAGRRAIVPVAGLLRLLLADTPDPAPAPDGRRLDPRAESSVDATTTPPADYTRHRWRRHHPEHPGDDE